MVKLKKIKSFISPEKFKPKKKKFVYKPKKIVRKNAVGVFSKLAPARKSKVEPNRNQEHAGELLFG